MTGAAAYALAPEPVRRYFVIGQPERRFMPFDVRELLRRNVLMPTLIWRVSVDALSPQSLDAALTVVPMYGGVDRRVALIAADWPLARA